MPNSRKKYFKWVAATHSDPNISDPIPKFKIWLHIFSSPRSEVSKKVCHALVGQKLREKIDFLETGHTLGAS
jgi:hypothetical protein